MLSSTLSLDEEEAVQEELRQLQAETVCPPPAADVFANVSQVAQAVPPKDYISLPNAPSSEPIQGTPEGMSYLFKWRKLQLTRRRRTRYRATNEGCIGSMRDRWYTLRRFRLSICIIFTM